MEPQSYTTHTGPGRRFATGSCRGDHLLGLFGLVSHLFLFFAMGVGTCLLFPEYMEVIYYVSLGVAIVLFVARAIQAGASTTKESLAAIGTAWSKSRYPS